MLMFLLGHVDSHHSCKGLVPAFCLCYTFVNYSFDKPSGRRSSFGSLVVSNYEAVKVVFVL